MPQIPASPIASSPTGPELRSKPSGTAGGDFGAAFDSAAALAELVNDLIENITASRKKPGASQDNITPQFPFSPAFESTFGTSGPLPEFINRITSKLGLTAEQNLAFQQIAVNNKDIVKTPESVQKIARELKAAGIGYRAS